MIQSDKDLPNLKYKASTLHLAWLVTKQISCGVTSSHELSEKFGVVDGTECEFHDAIKLATELRWISLVRDSFQLLEHGKSAMQAKHWRLIASETQAKEFNAFGLQKYLLNQDRYNERPKVLDLFAGVGGLALGFEGAGFNVVASIDNDPQACEAHRKNFPDAAVIQEDITLFAKSPKDILKKYGVDGEIDGVIGGPPCQGFSYMGERVVDDDRNFLTTRFTDVVLSLKPKFFLMENVAGLQTIGSRPTIQSHVSSLAKSIGRPATEITNALPDVCKQIAKRSPQFRKRTVSAAVTGFKQRILENASGDFSTRSVIKALENCENEFLTCFELACSMNSEILVSSHEWVEEARVCILDKCSEIIRIAVGALVEARLEKEKYDVEGFLEEIVSTSKNRLLKKVIQEVLDSYWEQPTSQRYGGNVVGPILYRIIKRLDSQYNIAQPRVLNAYAYGAPQSRNRLFLIGVRKDLGDKFDFPEATHELPGKSDLISGGCAPTCEDVLADLPDVDSFDHLVKSDLLTANCLNAPFSKIAFQLRGYEIDPANWNLPRPEWNPLVVDCCTRTIHTKEVVQRLQTTAQGIQEKTSGKTRLKRNGVSHTLRAGTREAKGSHTAVRPVHYEYNRVVTVREGARLMGFPDWMTFHPTKWHGFRLVGNAVPFHLGYALAKKIMATIK